MNNYVRLYLKLLLVGFLLLTAATAQTNEIPDWEPTFEAAWGDLGHVYTNERGHFCIPNELVGSTRLIMWNHYFLPHPFSNLYSDELFDREMQAEHWRIEHHQSEARFGAYERSQGKRKIAWFFVGTGIGAFITGSIVRLISQPSGN